MTNPAEQFAALAKANFGLCVRLGQIAAEEGEECLRIGNKAMFAIAEQGRTVATRVAPVDKSSSETTSAGSPDAFNLFAEVQKGQQRIGGDVKRAMEEWQRAWTGALIPSPETKTGADLFGLFFKPWLGRTTSAEETKPATNRASARTPA